MSRGDLWSTLLRLSFFASSPGSAPAGCGGGSRTPSAACWGWGSLPLQPGHLRMARDVPGGGRRPQEDEDTSRMWRAGEGRRRGERGV